MFVNLVFLAEGREQLLQINTREVPLEDSIDMKEIAKLLEGYSGADITNVCRLGSAVAHTNFVCVS